jgi:hypothetical protein
MDPPRDDGREVSTVLLNSDPGRLFLDDVATVLLNEMGFHRVRRELHSVLCVAMTLQTDSVRLIRQLMKRRSRVIVLSNPKRGLPLNESFSGQKPQSVIAHR